MKHTQEQINNTLIECDNMIKSGMIQVSKSEYLGMLKDLGLFISVSCKRTTLLYYNIDNPQHYLCCSVTPVSEDGIGYAYTSGLFYRNEIIPQTAKYLRLKEIRNTYFCVLPTGHILSI